MNFLSNWTNGGLGFYKLPSLTQISPSLSSEWPHEKKKTVFLNQPLHIKHELECKLQVEIQWPRHSRIVTHLLPKRSSGLKNSKGRDTKVKWVLGLTLNPTPQNAGYLSTYTTFYHIVISKYVIEPIN